MKRFGLFAAVLSLAFLAACGGGGPANPGTGAAGFTNASFTGHYVFTLMGQCASVCASTSVIRSVGTMVSDGNGNITSGVWDLNVGGADQTLTGLTGTYSVASDGKVSLNLTAGGNTDSYLIVLTSTTGGYIVSTDAAWALSGVVEAQSTSAIGTQPAGNYVFGASGLTSGGAAWALAGAMNLGAGTVALDMNNNGTTTNLATGAVASSTYDNTTGRGALTLTTGTLPTMSFAYYVVDANTLEMVSDDVTGGSQGRAEVTGGAVGSGNVLSGPFAFLLAGFPPSSVGGIAQITEGGTFTGDGAGNISSGVIDTVYDANGQTGVSFTGTGAVTSAGGVTRDALTFVPGSGINVTPTTHADLWLTNAGRGFFITTDTDRAEAGTINAQTGGPTYANNGTFGFYQSGFAIQNGSAEGLNNATLFKNSSGSVTGYTQGLNLLGSPNLNTGTGQFANDSTNIGELTLNNTAIGTEHFRIYQYSASSAFIMEADQGSVSSGLMTVQTGQQ